MQPQFSLFPEQTKYKSSAPTILDFTIDKARSIWRTQDHLDRSLGKIKSFSEFSDFSTRPIDCYTPSHIYLFLEYLEDELGRTNATLNRYHSAINSVFKRYGEECRVDILPRVSWKKESSGRPRFFSDVEICTLLEIFRKSSHPWAADFVVFALQTGMRKSEINGIGISSEEAQKDQCVGSVSTDRITGQMMVHLKNTKNYEDRLIPLNTEAQDALKNLSFKPSLHYKESSYYSLWNYAREKICPNDATFVSHVCRHTAGTNLASKGFNDTQIGRLLGHKSPLTTKKYVHPDMNTTLKMVASL